MTRATRSSATQEKEKHVETPPAPKKTASKKRKRTSAADTSEQPVNKLARTKDGIKEEASQEPEEQPLEAISKPELQSSGDVPILPEDAEQILEVLEMCVPLLLLREMQPRNLRETGSIRKAFSTEYFHYLLNIPLTQGPRPVLLLEHSRTLSERC